MQAGLQQFNRRIEAVMAQAASFDAVAIAKAQDELQAWVTELGLSSLSAEELGEVRHKLCSYRDLCSFLQRTLNQALAQAGRIEGAGYTGRGPSIVRAHPLMRRYG